MKAAENGNPQAQMLIGSFYAKGECGLPHEDKKAFEYYLMASEAGQTAVLYELAQMYLQGVGTSQNLTEGVRWMKKAAEIR